METTQEATPMRTKEQIDQEYTMLAQQVGDIVLKSVPYLLYALGRTVELQKEPKRIVEPVKEEIKTVVPEVLPAEAV